MSLENNPKKEFPKEMLVKVADEDLRNFLGYRELSNHFIGGIKDEELRAFFFERKCKDLKSLTVLEVDKIIFNKIGIDNIKNIEEKIYILKGKLDYFFDSIDYVLDEYHKKNFGKELQPQFFLNGLYGILDELNNFIETNLLQLNSFLIEELDNRTIKMLKYILSKIEMINKLMDELEIFFGNFKDFSKFKNKFQCGFLQFLKYKIEGNKDEEERIKRIEESYIFKDIRKHFNLKKISIKEELQKEVETKKKQALVNFDKDMFSILGKHQEIGQNMSLIITGLLEGEDIIDIVKVNTLLFQEIIEIILSNPVYTNKDIKKFLTKTQKEILYRESSSIILFKKVINQLKNVYGNTNQDINKLINIFCNGFLRLWENKVCVDKI